MDIKEEQEFNGYDFSELKMRRKMKYVVITRGDLDINNAYAFKTKKELTEYLKEAHSREVEAVFEVKDITL
jgi:hypothetical protein